MAISTGKPQDLAEIEAITPSLSASRLVERDLHRHEGDQQVYQAPSRQSGSRQIFNAFALLLFHRPLQVG